MCASHSSGRRKGGSGISSLIEMTVDKFLQNNLHNFSQHSKSQLIELKVELVLISSLPFFSFPSLVLFPSNPTPQRRLRPWMDWLGVDTSLARSVIHSRAGLIRNWSEVGLARNGINLAKNRSQLKRATRGKKVCENLSVALCCDRSTGSSRVESMG